MSDLLGERSALEQTRIIIAKIEPNSVPASKYKQLVQKIYDNQLKKYTNYNRSQRHNLCNNLFKKRTKDEQKSPTLLSHRALRKVLNEKQGTNHGGVGE